MPRPRILVLVEHGIPCTWVGCAASLVSHRCDTAGAEFDAHVIVFQHAGCRVRVVGFFVAVDRDDAKGGIPQRRHLHFSEQQRLLVGVLGTGRQMLAGVVEVAHASQLVGYLLTGGVDELQLRRLRFREDRLEFHGLPPAPSQGVEHGYRLCLAVSLDTLRQRPHRFLAVPVRLIGDVPA